MVDLSSKPFNLSDEDILWVEETKNALSLEEKIGQLFDVQCYDMTNFVSLGQYDARSAFEKALKYHAGGLHLFGFTPESTKSFQQKILNDVQRSSKIPLLISGDMEKGGAWGAFDGTNFGTQMQVAATNDEEVAQRYGEVIATESTAMGFNWHFGPVVDINYNFRNTITNTRSFGDTPAVVTKFATPIIKTIQSFPMAACAKHWPGDGVDDRDQHVVLSINSMSMNEWRDTYKKVYKDTIDAGVLSVMSAHIALPSFYEELGIIDVEKKHTPGSLSFELNQKLLREELGFNGLIVSDATPMTGMESYCPRNELVPRSIAAGVDMFLFVLDLEYDFNAMLEGFNKGIITEERLDEAVTRILGLKATLRLHKAKENGT
ncbi:MAG: glycoside hydrolase family 3 N-terminal domain-containing protein, partial [Anaerolineales bacterium]